MSHFHEMMELWTNWRSPLLASFHVLCTVQTDFVSLFQLLCKRCPKLHKHYGTRLFWVGLKSKTWIHRSLDLAHSFFKFRTCPLQTFWIHCAHLQLVLTDSDGSWTTLLILGRTCKNSNTLNNLISDWWRSKFLHWTEQFLRQVQGVIEDATIFSDALFPDVTCRKVFAFWIREGWTPAENGMLGIGWLRCLQNPVELASQLWRPRGWTVQS